MLVLNRKRDQNVVLLMGGKVLGKITLVRIAGNRVRLGFEFIPDVDVVRAELLKEWQQHCERHERDNVPSQNQ